MSAILSQPQCVKMVSHECQGVLIQQPMNCLFKSLLRLTTTGNIKALHYWLLCVENPLVTGGFLAQRPSNLERVFILQCHHVTLNLTCNVSIEFTYGLEPLVPTSHIFKCI